MKLLFMLEFLEKNENKIISNISKNSELKKKRLIKIIVLICMNLSFFDVYQR